METRLLTMEAELRVKLLTGFSRRLDLLPLRLHATNSRLRLSHQSLWLPSLEKTLQRTSPRLSSMLPMTSQLEKSTPLCTLLTKNAPPPSEPTPFLLSSSLESLMRALLSFLSLFKPPLLSDGCLSLLFPL